MSAATWLDWCRQQRRPHLPEGFDPTVKVPLSIVEALACLAVAAVDGIDDLSPEERDALAVLEGEA